MHFLSRKGHASPYPGSTQGANSVQPEFENSPQDCFIQWVRIGNFLQNRKTQELLTPAFGRSRIIGFHEIRSIKRFCSHVFFKMLSTSDAPENGLCRPRFFSLGHFVTKLRPSALASGRRQRAQHATTSGQPVPKSPGLGRLPNKRFCSPTGCKNSKCGHTCPACR